MDKSKFKIKQQAQFELNKLAQKLESSYRREDLIASKSLHQEIEKIILHIKNRGSLLDNFGMSRIFRKGGVVALFSGVPGTGKTMAAEIIANELKLDIYKIYFSQVVNKYIGETEKNLRRIFDAAETGGAILLFDEVDALFGKRIELKDSHDRYANIEVNYLLQRMEAYRGLAILTTNMKDAIDKAFLRRIRYVVHFPSPDKEQRKNIWTKYYTEVETENKTEISDSQIKELATKADLTGGQIKNSIITAKNLARKENKLLNKKHLLLAIDDELQKFKVPK